MTTLPAGRSVERKMLHSNYRLKRLIDCSSTVGNEPCLSKRTMIAFAQAIEAFLLSSRFAGICRSRPDIEIVLNQALLCARRNVASSANVLRRKRSIRLWILLLSPEWKREIHSRCFQNR